MTHDELLEEARRLAAVTHSQTELVLDYASDAERAAGELDPASFINRRKAERKNVIHIDWATGERWIADVVPLFPDKGRAE